MILIQHKNKRDIEVEVVEHGGIKSIRVNYGTGWMFLEIEQALKLGEILLKEAKAT
jgi:hypothetical protein